MASPAPPSDDAGDVTPPSAEGGGLLERIGAQLASLTAQVSEMDQRMDNVEAGTPSQPVEVQLSPETIAQIADALAALQAAGSQALDDAFKSASDDLTDALSGVVRAEVSRTLSEAGYTVVVSEAEAPADAAPAFEPLVEAPAAASAPAAMPSIAAPLAASSAVEELPQVRPEQPLQAAEPVQAVEAAEAVQAAEAASPVASGAPGAATGLGEEPDMADMSDDADEIDETDNGEERPPLTLAELDDPFLDALIRKEPLSA